MLRNPSDKILHFRVGGSMEVDQGELLLLA